LALIANRDYERAGQLFEEALGVSRAIGNKREIAWNLGALGLDEIEKGGDHASARQLLEESMAIGRESGDVTPLLNAIGLLSRICVLEGDAPQARRMIEQGVTYARQFRMHAAMALMIALQGNIAMRESDWGTAEDLYREAIQVLSVASRDAAAEVVRHYAAMLGKRGDHRRAVRFLAAAANVGDAVARGWMVTIDPEEVKQAARSALGEPAFAEAWAEGQSMTLAQAAAELMRE
jgi:tetratricopeptide (TPR) repeat protein